MKALAKRSPTERRSTVAWSTYADPELAGPIHANSVGVRLAIDTGAVTVGAYCQRVPQRRGRRLI